LASLLLALLIARPTTLRLALGIALVAFFVALTSRTPIGTLYFLVVWLAGLGLVRRVTTGISPAGSVDVLLVVGATAIACLTIAAAERGTFRNRTVLSHGVLALTVLAFLEAFNPLEGSLFAGLSGLLFVLVPLLAFWAGRVFCNDRTLTVVLAMVGGLSLLAAAYGHFQTFQGFPSWDAAWITQSGYTALNVGGVIRPFGTFASASEYATFVAIGVVVWLAFGMRFLRLVITLAAVSVLVFAIFLVSTRGVVFMLAAGLGLMAAARRGLPAWAAMVTAVGLIFLLPAAVSWVAPRSAGSGAQSALVAHQIDGLRDPLDQKSSTLGQHATLVTGGLSQALTHPLGQGIGKVTIAGSKFGGTWANTEADPSNAAVSMGIAGVLAYAVVAVAGFRRAYQRAVQRRDGLALAGLGVLVITFLQWLNGGQYAVVLLPWLVLGWLDRPVAAAPTSTTVAAAAQEPAALPAGLGGGSAATASSGTGDGGDHTTTDQD
jgi:hypothetical protein